MPKLDELVKSMQDEEKEQVTEPDTAKPEEVTPEQPVEPIAEVAAEVKDEPEVVKPDEPEAGKVEETPVEPAKPKYTEKEMAEYSFRKRLDRQSKKYQSEIDELKKELEALKNPVKELKREDFASDQDFVDAYFKNSINKALAERDKRDAAAKQAELEQTESLRRFADNIKKDFDLDEYNKVVEPVLQNGLADLISTNESVADYIKNNPNGAKVLYTLATDRNAAESVFMAYNPFEQYYALKKIEENFRMPVRQNPVQTPNPTVPVAPVTQPKPIGKVGETGGKVAGDQWDDPKWLINRVRTIR